MILTFIIITLTALILRFIKGKKILKKILYNGWIKVRSYETTGISSPDPCKNPFDKNPWREYLNPEKRYLKFNRKRFLQGNLRIHFSFVKYFNPGMVTIPVKNDLNMIRRSCL
jgi:hypothetical protein